MPVRLFLAAVLLLCVRHALADLYRWVDPETGATKFSSYPPPWYGDPEQERRAPKVERIPEGRPGVPAEAAGAGKAPAAKPPPPAGSPALLEERRRALLKQLLERLTSPSAATAEEAMRGLLAIAEPMREYRSIESALAQADPQGEPARRKEWGVFVATLEAKRKSMATELQAVPPPGPNVPALEAQRQFRQLQAKLVAFGGIAGALKVLDPDGDAARMAELQALEQKLTAAWRAQIDLLKPQPQPR